MELLVVFKMLLIMLLFVLLIYGTQVLKYATNDAFKWLSLFLVVLPCGVFIFRLMLDVMLFVCAHLAPIIRGVLCL